MTKTSALCGTVLLYSGSGDLVLRQGRRTAAIRNQPRPHGWPVSSGDHASRWTRVDRRSRSADRPHRTISAVDELAARRGLARRITPAAEAREDRSLEGRPLL